MEKIQQAKDEQNKEKGEEDVEDMIKFKVAKSSSSFLIKDITGFIYGGLSSRFWMLRKHTNFLDK
jgi:hypothetical protein